LIKIYKLFHPSSNRLYIGKTCRSLKRRLWGHVYESNKHPHLRKSKWIKSLIRKGFTPEIILIEEVEDNLGNDREKHHIKLGWENSPMDMLNSPSMPGGEGFQKGKNLSKKSRNKSARNRRKFSNEELQSIATRVNRGEYAKDIAKEYGVHRITIMRNLRGSVIGTKPIECNYNRPNGARHGMSKINMEIANEIRSKYSSGNYFQYQLAKEYKIAQASVWSILKNKTWK